MSRNLIQQAPTEILLSDTMLDRQEQIRVPLAFNASVAVDAAMRKAHDDDTFGWHQRRPTMKHCPYDDACRFC